ncbi:ATP-binding protein [Marinomonas algicola]|uniref:ATP-binding protein n=1 Tax=Marinomonas algicola TaxID=2773454 RepID=UPI00174815A0|nr:ATP-binding protein [Marinomonas algicola]
MPLRTVFSLQHLGIGGRLFLAFFFISSITIIASALATNTYLQLSDRLQLLKQQDIPGLDAAARLNDRSRLIVATAPLLVTNDANIVRLKAMKTLNDAIKDMDSLMKSLPEYNHYFLELIRQIQNNLILLNQNVERHETAQYKISQLSKQIFPAFQALINRLNTLERTQPLEKVTNRLYYFAGMLEKVANDATFNELDYTFLRLESLAEEIQDQLPLLTQVPKSQIRSIQLLLAASSREGDLYKLKNEELDLVYQQDFFLENSQRHIQQLAAQIIQYTNTTNTSISDSLERAIQSINQSTQSILLLSLISLTVACAISWFYVRRNILHRIRELQQNMRAIASSHLDTEIRIVGNDEVSSMARDLQYFQQTAIEVERTNQKLATEIEERVMAEMQLKNTQTELIQAGKLAALGQLSVGITHEINQPLTAIASHLHTVGRYLDRDEPENAKVNIIKITSLLDKIARITRHLKAFAREAGTELSPVTLDRVIQDSIELMSSQINDQNCHLHYDRHSVPHLSELKVLAEPIRLEQVLVNLISNAIDAMSSTLYKQITIRVREEEKHVFIDVSDTGIGIEADKIRQIFDPFFTQKEVGQGLGLGLSISYNIIQDFHGHIQTRSTLGQGSCFQLVLQKANDL